MRAVDPPRPSSSEWRVATISGWISFGILLGLSICLIGCHGGSPTPSSGGLVTKTPEVPTDHEAALFKKLRSADVQVDGAVNELNDAMQQVQKMAPTAGGDATKALVNVSKQFDEAGETLGDYENVSETLDDFKKNFATQDDRRLRCIKTVLDALPKINEGANVLTDLAQNVPESFKKDLTAITQTVAQIQSDLEQAVVSMGGQLPDDGPTESEDPAQDQPDKTPKK